MQAQAVRPTQRAISHTQSIEAVQTLLKAGLGCIAWLRDLLPTDNFSHSYFATNDDSFAFEPLTPAERNSAGQKGSNSFKIMSLNRGFTPEADQILDYLERGIFDALEKKYLRSFTFGVYLDANDPHNMVEVYTFNFDYHRVPGTNDFIPVVSLDEGDLKNSKVQGHSDPISEAIQNGRVPTFKDVKKSVKTLIKTLISFIQTMEELPKRCFVTFKIYYHDHTPDDYEPPHFKAGDADKDKWYFMTHEISEAPDRLSVGTLKTGHHSMNVASIVTHLPSNGNESAPFSGVSSRAPDAPALTPAEEASRRERQAERQLEDAKTRTVVWTADEIDKLSDEDAECEDDPDFVKELNDSGIGLIVPLGKRTESGNIEPLEVEEETHFGGVSQNVPQKLCDMDQTHEPQSGFLTETQPIFDSAETEQLSPRPATPARNSALPPSSLFPPSPLSDISQDDTDGLDAQMKKSLVLRSASFQPGNDDSEMLDLETQQERNDNQNDSIASFGSSRPRAIEDIQVDDDLRESTAAPQMQATMIRTRSIPLEQSGQAGNEDPIDCECGITRVDDCLQCDGGCKRWHHIWCVGLHSCQDERMPGKYVCFDCRLRADVSWELLKLNVYPTVIAKFKDLALFRRGIKTAEAISSFTPAEYSDRMGCDNSTAWQILKRLEKEGFVSEQGTANLESNPGRARGKAKIKSKPPAKPRKNFQRQRFSFNFAIKTTSTYLDYFLDDPMVDPLVMGTNLKSAIKGGAMAPNLARAGASDFLPYAPQERREETQDESQLPISGPLQLNKRLMTVDSQDDLHVSERPKKKPKVSVATGVDLAE